MATKLFFTFLLLSLLSLTNCIPNNSILKATELLSNAGFVAMALTLEFTSHTLPKTLDSLTVFAPPDTAFSSSGQPSLALLRYHFSPHSYSSWTLRSLPFNYKITTLTPNRSLTVTSSPTHLHLTINFVQVNLSAIYDDGSLRIFGIGKFFDLEFRLNGNQNPNSECISTTNDDSMRFDSVSKFLDSKGYSTMASFLDLQLWAVKNRSSLTVFAFDDEGMMGYVRDFKDYPEIFLAHVVPYRLLGADLLGSANGTEHSTFLNGFKIRVKASNNVCTVNGVAVASPNLYINDWLVVHGVRDFLLPQVNKQTSKLTSRVTSGCANFGLWLLKTFLVFASLCILLYFLKTRWCF